MRRPAFTLLETVISLAVMVVLLSAAVTTNRIATRNLSSGEVRRFDTLLAEQGRGRVEATVRSLRATGGQIDSSQLADAFGVPPAGLAGGAPVPTLPFVQSGAPPTLSWCGLQAGGRCDGRTYPLTFSGSNVFFTDLAGSAGSESAEVIAVRATAPGPNDLREGDLVDSVSAGSTGYDPLGQSVYCRLTSLQKQAGPTVGSQAFYSVTVSVWDLSGAVPSDPRGACAGVVQQSGSVPAPATSVIVVAATS